MIPSIDIKPLVIDEFGSVNERLAKGNIPDAECSVINGLAPDKIGRLSRIHGKQFVTKLDAAGRSITPFFGKFLVQQTGILTLEELTIP